MDPFFQVALTAAFVGGLAGGVHCAGMCGGIVRALCGGTDRAHASASLRYILAYNAGRLLSYTCAGVAAGTLGSAGLLTRAAPLLQPVMFALASMMLILLGLYLAGTATVIVRLESAGAWLWRGISPWTRQLLPVNTLPRALGLGALWGWLPCGMVYAVLLTALAFGDGRQGALLMLAFGLGTLPNLLGIALVWNRMEHLRRRSSLRLLAGGTVVLFGIYGLIKILVPGIASEDGWLCHVAPGLAAWLR